MSASDDGARREARDSAAAARLARKVARPLLGALPSELVEILPGVEPGVVPVVEYQFHRVLTDRLDEGECTRRYSKGSSKRLPSAKVTSSTREARRRRISVATGSDMGPRV